jgi:NAD(P)-dependent dehydrogenase (short-subunit alcohol dehydrogenase family)
MTSEGPADSGAVGAASGEGPADSGAAAPIRDERLGEPSFDLRGDGRVALVTGGALGLGREVATVLGAAGYRVAILDVDAAAGRACEAELGAAGVAARFFVADVADAGQVAEAVAAARACWGRLDFVLNNAGIVGRQAKIEDLDEADAARVLAVDLSGPLFVCKHAVRAMREGGGGSILNVSSISARTGSAYFPAYSAAKAGVIALTRSMARHTGRYRIRVNCLAPGSIEGTGLMRSGLGREPTAGERRDRVIGLLQQVPLGRAARMRDVAYLALFLASPLAAHVHGAVFTIDGGESLGCQA